MCRMFGYTGNSMEDHVQFLKDAGFSIIDFPWKYTNNMVLLAMV